MLIYSKIKKIKNHKSEIKKVPEEAGVYIFWKNKKPIYIGKAINLRSRLESYFATRLAEKTSQMVHSAESISSIKVPTEIEALLLEAELVWKYKPKFNRALKDDKHPLYIVVTKEHYPRVLMLKRSQLPQVRGKIFGPFPSTSNMRWVLKMLRPIFTYSTHTPGLSPCLYSQMGLCNPCPGSIENEKDSVRKSVLYKNYLKNVRDVRGVLSGRITWVKNNLNKEMIDLAASHKYEEAQIVKKQIERLNYITTPKPDVNRFIQNPNLIEDLRASELKDLKNLLAPYLNIKRLKRIECYDIAHLAGSESSASMVTFIEGAPQKTLYRHFRIKRARGGDDPGGLSEIAQRRAGRLKSWGRPDLIIVDGGKAQSRVFWEVFNQLGVPVVGLAKRFETLVVPVKKQKIAYIFLRPKGDSLALVKRIRDEAHRFARRYHHLRLRKKLLATYTDSKG